MKTQDDADSLPADSSRFLNGDRSPTLIFTSRGSRTGNQPKPGTSPTNRIKDDNRLRSSFGSSDTALKVGTSGNRGQSTVMNGDADTDLASKDKKVNVSSTAPSDAEAGVSLQRTDLPLPTMQNVNVGVQKRKSLSFSRKSSFSLPVHSLTRRFSYDLKPAVLTKPPPLIPAPKSFIHRRLSSSKRKDKFHLPPSHYRLTYPSVTDTQQNDLSDALHPSVPLLLPQTPPLPVNYSITQDTSVSGLETDKPSFLELVDGTQVKDTVSDLESNKPSFLELLKGTQVKDTSVSDSETNKLSFLELVNGTHTNQYSQTSPAIASTSTPPSPPSYPSSLRTSPFSLPPPHFRFPSPPHSPPPPPSPTLLDEPDSNIISLVSASTFSSPHAEEDTVRKKSVTPSEAMGCLDEAIAVHKLSSSSFADSVGQPDFSPAFNFNTISKENLPGTFTSNSLSAAEPEDSTIEAGATKFATRAVNAASLQHAGIATLANPQIVTTTTAKYIDKVDSFEDDVGKTPHHPRHDVSSDQAWDDEQKQSGGFKEQETRKQSISPKKVVEVLKLQHDVKTVRQQIKPGIVGELASLFQNMGDEYDVTSPGGASHPTTAHSIQTREEFAKSNRQQSPEIIIGNSLNVWNTEVFSRTKDGDIYSRSQPSDSSEQAPLKSSLGAASVEELRIKPGMDYLTASKEIFKHMIEHRSQSETNSLKKDVRENKVEIQDLDMEDNVVFPSVLTSSTPNKMEQKIATSTENKETHSYTNSVRTKPLKTDMKFHGNTADFNTVLDETTSLVTKSPTGGHKEFSGQADLKPLEGAVQEPTHIRRIDGALYAPNHVNDFNTDDMSHVDYTENIKKPLSTMIEVSSDRNRTGPEFELEANIRQDEQVRVTQPVSETATNSKRVDELKPITGNDDRNAVAVASSTKTRPLSHVISNWEPLLATADTESTNAFMNINKGQPLTCVSDFDTLGDTPVEKSGSESPIQTNQGSLRSRSSLSTQTVNKSQANNDKDFENTTSFTSGWKSMVGTKLGISSNNDAGVTDGGAGLDNSPVSRLDISCVPDETDGVNHRTTETGVYSIGHKNGYNAEQEGDYGGHRVRDEARGDSSLTVSEVPTGSLVEDYLHKQTVDVSFRPPASSNHSLLAGEVKDEHRDTGGVDLNSKLFSDQVSSDLFMKFPESFSNTQKSDANSAVDINGIEPGNADASVKPHPDDFLSILDDITIQTDITSAFLRSSRRTERFPTENHHDGKEQASHLVEKQKDPSDTTMKSVDKRLLQESLATYNSSGQTFDEPPVEGTEFDYSLPESTEITAATSFLSMRGQADLNHEIEQQHNAMSSRLSESAEHDNVLTHDSDSTRSHRSSVSSMTWSRKGSTSGASKETMFNSEFFSKSEVTLGRSHQASPQTDTMEKETVNLNSHAGTFENTLHSYTTVNNLNEDVVTSESEWITPTEVPRLIPWSEYAERAQIPFISVSDNSGKEPADTLSHRSSISSTCSNGKQNNKDEEGMAVTRDVFSKQQATNSSVERRVSRNESLITASKVIRSIPWEEYEEKLNIDVEPVEPVGIVKSSNSDVEHSHRDVLEEEIVKSIGSQVSSQGPGDSLDGSSTTAGKEIHEELDKKYSQDTHERGFGNRSGDYRDHASDSNNNTLSAPATPTRENSNTTEFTSRPPHVFSNEADEVGKQKQDEIIKSKNKFQALKNVFEKQDFENRSKPAAGFLVKRDSFKFSAGPLSPTRAVSRTKNDKNGGMSIEGNVTSQHETGVYVSRDIDHTGVGVQGAREKTDTEIERPQRRDSHSTDTSSGSGEGGVVDTRGTRATTKKSKQTGLAYEVQAEELVRHSLSRNSSAGSSLSSHSVNTAERLSSHIQPVGGHFSTDEHRIGQQPHTQSWAASVDSFGLDKNVELPLISDTSSITHTSPENGGLEIPTGRSENTPSTESDNKQTDLIDTFLRSGVGARELGHNQTSLNGTQEAGHPSGHISLDNSVVRGISQRGLFGQSRERDSDSDHESGIISVDHGIDSVNLKTDTSRRSSVGHFEPNNFHSANDEEHHSDKMTAVVGEVSSFSIHKKITREESFGVHSESSSTVDSPRDNLSARHGQSVAPDLYLIADKKGDYYALQEVQDEAGGGRVVTDNTNLHVLEMSRSDGHSRATDSSATNHDHYPPDGGITDVYIDSSSVDDDKARELISAYLDAQELNRQQNNTVNGVHTYHDSLTTQQLYSRKSYSEDVTQRGAIEADDDTGKSYADNSSRVPGTSEFVSTTKNGSIVVQQNGYSGVTGSATHPDNYAASNSYISSSTQQHDGTANNVYMSTSSRFEQLNASSGDQDSFTSSYHLTRLSSPQVPTLASSVVDTGYGTRRTGDYSRSQSSDGTSHVVSQPGVIPFQTKPLTITTTTQAVVGEQVGMRIDYPQNGAPDAFISSSDEESNQKRYIVKNVQQKSSMKNTSRHDSRSFSDSNSDTVFSPGRVTTQYNTIGTTRDIHQSRDLDTRNIRIINGSDSLSPRSVADEPVHRAYQSSAVHSLPRTSNDYNRSYTQENAFNSSREDEHNLYKVRNLSTSVPDGLQYIGEHRGRSGKKSPKDATTNKDYKTGRKQHHSPERIFKNAKLSLRKDDYDNDYYSDEENDNTQYRTVTKVYLNENKPRSRSQSPDTRYKVSTARTAQEKRQDLDETDSGYQEQHRRFIVVGTSDSSENSHGVNAHSSPKLARKRTKSFEEATITRTELVQPSRINNEPPSTKTHKTVIQLEVDENTTKDRSRSEDIDSQYKVNRARSVHDFHTESRSTLTTSNREQSMWRTGGLRSRSSSEDGEVDRPHQAGMYATSPRLTATSKQEDGGKLYVVNSTLPRELSGALDHAGLYKSTIDINQSRPNTVQSVNDLLSQKLREDILDSHNYRTEKSVYFVREAAPQTSTNKSFRSHHSTDLAYPDSGTGTEVTSSDGENEVRQKFERVERIYEVRSQPQLPEHFQSMEDLSNDLRVLRGNILIKNRLNDTDHGHDDFDENVNLFDNSFHLGKDNPLFSSDPDILASLQREEQEAMASHVHQDITFETVDKIAHEYRQEKEGEYSHTTSRVVCTYFVCPVLSFCGMSSIINTAVLGG